MISITVQKQLGTLKIDAKFESQTRGIVALFGQSGSGKTSIINMIAGLLEPDCGHIEIDGRVLYSSETGTNLKIENRRIGYVFQESRLFPHMTVHKNLEYGRKRTSSDDHKVKYEQVIGVLGIVHLLNQKPTTLSGGEQQRVALGRALLANPDILLMDEPLASLDDARKSEILPFIEMIRNSFDIPIIYVSHALDEIIRLADTLVLIENGEIAAVGPVEELTSRLDLRRLTGRYDAGSVISMTIDAHDEEYGLTKLSFVGGMLRVPRISAEPGSTVRVRIKARDVSLAVQKPEGISQINILHGTITEIGNTRSDHDATTPHDIDICVDIGVPLWVRITRWSLDHLDLSVGKEVYALIKSTSIDRQSVGQQPRNMEKPL